MTVTPVDRRAFLSHLLSRDRKQALAVAMRLADDGTPLAEILTQLVAAAQVEVGERWHANDISVADEHAATAVADHVVAVVTAQSGAVEGGGRRVVVACAEGEWHVLPARITAEVLRAAGCDVTFLGGSLPPTHLRTFLETDRPDVVALSVSTALAFAGALSSIEVSHSAGVPVIVGGRALGRDARRADALGADLWASDAPTAARVVADALPSHLKTANADLGEALALSLRRDDIVRIAYSRLISTVPGFSRYDDSQRARTREDLGYIMQFVEAAVLVRDPSVFDEFLQWLEPLLSARGVPSVALARSLAAIREAAPDVALLASAAPGRG